MYLHLPLLKLSGGKVVPSGVKMDQQQQQQQYNPVQQDRSILLNNQLNNKFKRW